MAKKSFKDNPALRFISMPPEPAIQQPSPPHAPGPSESMLPPMKPNPLYIETKSRRLNLLVQPSLHERIKKLAARRDTSVNDIIHQILLEYADREGA